MRPTGTARPRTAARSTLGVLALALPLALAGCGADEPAGTSADATGTGATTASTPASPSVSIPEREEIAGPADPVCPPASGAEGRTRVFSAAPPMCLEPGVDYVAVLTTDAGPVTVDLLEDKAPETVNNFVFLARHNYYEGVTFHRVIPGFMIQGGDPKGTGSGGPGYEFADELPAAGEYEIGSMAMANAGPDTNGSQFFIVTGDSGVSLPPQYSLFGKVTEGLETVRAIEADGSAQGRPTTVHTIEKVEIRER